MKQEYHYHKAHLLEAATVIRFQSLSEFCNYTELNNISSIFILTDENKEPADFAILQNVAVLKHPTEGYKTLEDFNQAEQNLFPDAVLYYEAIEAGYKKYSDYKLVKETGIANKDLYDKIKQKGFVYGYDEFIKLPETYPNLPAITTVINNPYQLYEYAVKNGFDNYKDFEGAYIKGFTDKPTYNVATEFGYPDYAEYKISLELGFRNFEELTNARKHKVRDRNDFVRLLEILNTGEPTNSNDEKLLMVLLSKLEQGKKISLNKLYDLFKKTIIEYRYPDTQTMPEWFTMQFDDKEKFVAFLTKEDQLTQYGDYDEDGEFFQINKMQDREVIIDASNVAHNSKGKNNTKPLVSNMIKMVAYLKQHGFTEISVIADASLKYKLGDPEKLKELQDKVDYRISPADTSADIFIINYVKRKRCLLVSNDTFKEWKFQDPWVAGNIDFYRLSFMIKEDEILMPDLK